MYAYINYIEKRPWDYRVNVVLILWMARTLVWTVPISVVKRLAFCSKVALCVFWSKVEE